MNKIGFNATKYFETPISLNDIKNLLEKPNSEKDNMEGLRYLFAVCSIFNIIYSIQYIN